MEENKRISELFDRARTQAPQTSYADVKKAFLFASTVGGASLLAKWAASSFKFKLIFMITTLSTLTVGGLLIVTQLTGNPNPINVKSDLAKHENTLNIEVKRENGVQQTTIYDEHDRIVKVIVDSSEKQTDRGGAVTISPNQPKAIKNGTIEPEIIRETPKTIQKRANTSDSLVMKKYEITDKTTSKELELIQEAATEAGIEFNYTARVKKDIIKRISMDMKIEDGKACWNSTISGTDSFSFVFGWWEDGSGKAVRFLSNDDTRVGAYRTQSK